MRSNARQRAILAVLLIVALASFMRLWQIGQLPPGLFGDEAANGLDALDVLEGRGTVFFRGNYGREGLFVYLVAAAFELIGVQPLAVRLVTAISGIATVLATYWLGRELFRDCATPLLASFVPLSAALWLAGSFWHILYSRMGVRVAPVPLFGTLAFAALWRGRHLWFVGREHGSPDGIGTPSSRAWAWFALAGVFLGLSAHFYSVSRLYPVLLGLFLLIRAGMTLARREERANGSGLALRHSLLWPSVVLFVVAAIVFAPLAWYFLSQPGAFTQRASVVSVFRQQTPLVALAQSVAGNLAQIVLPGRGYPSPVQNLPGRPLLEPITAVLALLGILIAARRWREPHFLLLLLWATVMLIPAFLAADQIPSPATRLIGAIPALYFLPAIAVTSIAEKVQKSWLPSRLRAILAALLLIVPLTASVIWAARDYFFAWGPSQNVYDAYEAEAVDAAAWLQANPQPWPVYVSAEFYRHMSFMMLYSQTPASEIFTARDQTLRWFDGRTALPLPPPPELGTYIFIGVAHPDQTWLDRHLPDRELIHQGLSPSGEPSFTVVRARGRSQPQNPTQELLMEGVKLRGYDVYGEARPGLPMQIALHWRFSGAMPEDEASYRIELAAIDAQSHSWPVATELLSFRPPEWDPGAGAISWHQIIVPSDASPGAFEIGVRLLDGRGGEALTGWTTLSSSRPAVAARSEPIAAFSGGLRLLDLHTETVETEEGPLLVAELILDTTVAQAQPFNLFLQVLDAQGQRIGQRDSSAGGGLFPTDAWQPGEPLIDTYHIALSSDASAADRIALGFYDWRTGERLPATSATGEPLPDAQVLLDLD